MKRYMCNIADMCLNLGVDDRDDDVRSGRGEYWPHDVAASLSTPHPRTRKGGGGGEEGGGERGGDGEGEGGG